MPIQFDQEQLQAIDLVTGDEPIVMVTGDAGTGKSTIVKESRKRIEMAFTATTGAAAVQIGGQTIDSLMCLDRETGEFRNPGKAFSNMQRCPRTIVIDEMSQLGARMAKPIFNLAKDSKKRIILVGDLAQAAPVKDEFATLSSLFLNAKRIKLRTVHRQADPEFISALNSIRHGEVSDEAEIFFRSRIRPKGELTDLHVRIYATNALVDAYNKSRLAAVPGNPVTLFGNYEDLRPPKMAQMYPLSSAQWDTKVKEARFAHGDEFKVGTKVLLTRNVYDKSRDDEDEQVLRFCNGDTGTLVAFKNARGEDITSAGSNDAFSLDDLDCVMSGAEPEEVVEALQEDQPDQICYILVKLDRTGEVVQVPQCAHEYKDLTVDVPDNIVGVACGFPIRLGFAATVHRCQGMSIPFVYVDIDSILHHRGEGRHGLAYVALSRCTTPSGLILSGWNPHAVYCNPAVKDFI